MDEKNKTDVNNYSVNIEVDETNDTLLMDPKKPITMSFIFIRE